MNTTLQTASPAPLSAATLPRTLARKLNRWLARGKTLADLVAFLAVSAAGERRYGSSEETIRYGYDARNNPWLRSARLHERWVRALADHVIAATAGRASAVDAQCHEWAVEAIERCHWIILSRSRQECAFGMPQPLASDTHAYWVGFSIREGRKLRALADRIIAARTAQAQQMRAQMPQPGYNPDASRQTVTYDGLTREDWIMRAMYPSVQAQGGVRTAEAAQARQLWVYDPLSCTCTDERYCAYCAELDAHNAEAQAQGGVL